MAEGFRQSFAGGRGKAFPFFQRRGIRQRDGDKFAPLISRDAFTNSGQVQRDIEKKKIKSVIESCAIPKSWELPLNLPN